MAEALQDEMKRGFLSLLILHSLKLKENHGYQIAQEIGEITNHTWSPSPSSVSRILLQLKKREIVQVSEIVKTGQREKKKYTLTPKGEQLLTLALKKTKDIVESMRTVLISIFGMQVDFAFDLFGLDLRMIDEEVIADLDELEKQVEDQIEYLREYKFHLREKFIEAGIEYLKKEKDKQ